MQTFAVVFSVLVFSLTCVPASVRSISDELQHLKERLHMAQILTAAELHERYLRVAQLEFQSSRFHEQDAFEDRDAMRALSTLYVVLDADATWSRWRRLLDAKNNTRNFFHTSLQHSSSAAAIEAFGRPYNSRDTTPSSLLLIKHRRLTDGFICTRLVLLGQRALHDQTRANTTSAGVAFDYQAAHQGTYWAAMLQHGSQTLHLTQRDAQSTVLKTFQQQLPIDILPFRVYAVAVEWIGSTIHVYINGQPVMSVERPRPSSPGALGVAVGQGHAYFYSLLSGSPLHRAQAPRYCFSTQ